MIGVIFVALCRAPLVRRIPVPYSSFAGYGVGVAATGVTLGHLWPVALSVVLVLAAAFTVRYGFRRGRGPLEP